jgi:NMD protein affecting ribosome stability and mRNA decay
VAYRERVKDLRARNATCANCAQFDAHLYSGICQLDSDFYGYMRVERDHLCDRWGERQGLR